MKNRLKAILKNRNQTAQELANEVGVAKSTTSKWVNNKAQPRPSMVERICKFFGIGIGDFYEMSDDDSK